nr:phosphatidylcholine transfer protein-like isoform X3 [Ipomoea batatas]
MVLVEAFWEILGPVWVAFFLGVIIGWTWKPKWASLGNCKFDFSAPSSPTAFVSSNARTPSFSPALYASWDEDHIGCDTSRVMYLRLNVAYEILEDMKLYQSQDERADINVITVEDLEHFCHLVERRDGGPCWKHMMDRSIPGLSYQAWQRDPKTGPPQYCSRTVYEDATPELLRDFFWDDEFRLKWDDMMVHASILDECPATGAMVLHWFPFFCSDREYIIGRRMWESERSYYCITKGVQCSSVPRRDRPRRVDLYYSSWFIQAVESRRENGELTACEVILFHHEDMGIPWELIKFGARQGMWGAVKKIESGLRAYQQARASGEPISHCASMAQTNTKIDPLHLKSEGDDEHSSSSNTKFLDSPSKKPSPVNIPKILLVSGAVAVACTLDGGLLLLPKALLFDIARKLANLGRRPRPGT